MKARPDKVEIIAEAGVNHNGSLALAKKLIAEAADAGADTIKFQTFRASNLVTRSANKAKYQIEQTGSEASQLEMLQNLELSAADHRTLLRECEDYGIAFLSSAFDLDSLNFLINDLHQNRIKFGSGELTNAPLLYAAGRAGCSIVLSTGMSYLSEIEQTLGVLALSTSSAAPVAPTAEQFTAAWANRELRQIVQQRVTLLHCTSQYPASFESVNLNVLDTLKTAFGIGVGYSDHTAGTFISEAAVAVGAKVIEKHLTLDRTMEGPDHAASSEPADFKKMVQNIRAIEQARGDGVKVPVGEEIDTASVAKKSLVALADIREGEVFTVDNLGVKRPGTGISPMHYWRFLGRKARRAYRPDDPIND